MYPLISFKYIFIVSFLCLGFHCQTLGQYYVDKRLDLADVEFEKKNYALALEQYLFDWNADEEKTFLLPQIAKCYLELKDYPQCLHQFKILEEKKIWRIEFEHTYLTCLMGMGQHEVVLDRILSSKLPMQTFGNYYNSSDSAVKWKKNPLGKIRNLSAINTSDDEIGACEYEAQLLFSSNRLGWRITNKSDRNHKSYFDFYLSGYKNDSSWHHPRLFSSRINTNRDEASACFNKNFDTLYFSKNKNKKSTVHLNLYRSSRHSKTWSKPQNFMMNDTSASFSHPFISSDGKIFLFASDMSGGYGGTDIYACVLIDSSWSLPINLGSTINSPKNEIYPFINSEGELFFASNGHFGMGGYDIFKSTSLNGKWTSPINMKFPMNSGADDYGYFEFRNKNIYFTSNRLGGKGGEDIYQYYK